eukprot:m.22057 g.22057  ORF g.22057 m.22057 type:complete len:65 (+) comp12845_c0_seq1:253-447(+)
MVVFPSVSLVSVPLLAQQNTDNHNTSNKKVELFERKQHSSYKNNSSKTTLDPFSGCASYMFVSS